MQIHHHLGRGERLLWSGRPVQGLRFHRYDAALVPMSLVWLGAVLAWERHVLREDLGLAFALFGLPFVAAGLFVVAGRFFWEASLRARTSYAVTDQRVLILCGHRSTSVPLAMRPVITVKGRDVVLGQSEAAPVLADLEDAAAVAEILRRAANR